ncbi:MAG: hypothetical protein K5669_06325 [Lachnospiraceae bacterium]|nr:hypothetical protein [Lachnospiraceae bacterium]
MSGETRQNEEKSKDRKKLLIIIIIVLVILLVAGAIVLAFVLGKQSSQRNTDSVGDNTGGTRETVSSVRQVADEESAASVYEQMKQEVEEGMFECKMSFDWSFEDGNAESKDAYVENSTNNTHPIYFDLSLQDTGELVYSSPVLPVGTKLTNIKLDKPLPAGTYSAVCMYSLLTDEESQEVISSAGFVVNIEVKN